jgi:cell division inhibitor SepF
LRHGRSEAEGGASRPKLEVQLLWVTEARSAAILLPASAGEREKREAAQGHDRVSVLMAFGRMAGWFGDPEHDEPSPSFGAAPDGFLGSPPRVSVVSPRSFEEAQDLADRFKRRQLVVVNLRNVDGEQSRRMVDFCAGLTYALDGQIQTVANRVFLLTPRNVEVSAEERKRLAERAFFNQL